MHALSYTTARAKFNISTYPIDLGFRPAESASSPKSLLQEMHVQEMKMRKNNPEGLFDLLLGPKRAFHFDRLPKLTIGELRRSADLDSLEARVASLERTAIAHADECARASCCCGSPVLLPFAHAPN